MWPYLIPAFLAKEKRFFDQMETKTSVVGDYRNPFSNNIPDQKTFLCHKFCHSQIPQQIPMPIDITDKSQKKLSSKSKK
jgi:hypothetical protein